MNTIEGYPVRSTAMDGEFNPTRLRDGDENQRFNWLDSDGMGIYVSWVPDQLSEQNARNLFSLYGEIESVRFVQNMKKKSLHVKFFRWTCFDESNPTFLDLEKIATAYPGYHEMECTLCVNESKQIMRTFQLKCAIDLGTTTRPRQEKNPRSKQDTRTKPRQEKGMRQPDADIYQVIYDANTIRIWALEQRVFQLEEQIRFLQKSP